MDGEDKADFKSKEILISLICSLEVIVNTLVDKGLLTREEYWRKLNYMKAKRNVVE
tara:strand:+ start:458 stop:625 length:168 start_codon:yes stop_codon:yes gene_type:complete